MKHDCNFQIFRCENWVGGFADTAFSSRFTFLEKQLKIHFVIKQKFLYPFEQLLFKICECSPSFTFLAMLLTNASF